MYSTFISLQVLIEGSINALRVSIAVKQADEIEKILCHKFMKFMMMRAENFIILRRKAVEGYDISFLITNFHTEQVSGSRGLSDYSICHSFCHSFCYFFPSIFLPVKLSSIILSIYPPVKLSSYLSVYLPICPSSSIFLSLSFFGMSHFIQEYSNGF